MQIQPVSKQTCVILAVYSGSSGGTFQRNLEGSSNTAAYPFPELVSAGHFEIQVLNDPKNAEFHEAMESFRPDFVYLQGEHLENNPVGNLVWGGIELSNNIILGLFASWLPNIVYLEIPEGEKLAESLSSKGIPYVIYWKNSFSRFTASHFHHAMFSAMQSSTAHVSDAFKLARASFDFYCAQKNLPFPISNHEAGSDLGPHLLGDPPKITLSTPSYDGEEDNQDVSPDSNILTIYDADVNMRFLLCGDPCALDDGSLGFLEDGLNALLNIEIRGSKLHNRVSAPPPPLQVGAVVRGVVTMRCDMSTSSSAYISLLVSGSAQMCFDDQVLENHVKNEIVEKSRLVHAVSEHDLSIEPRRSMAVACGAPVFQICMKVPNWASQVLRQLALDNTYRNFVTLGIAGIQGSPVACFEKDDVDRLLFFSTNDLKSEIKPNFRDSRLPHWLRPPPARTLLYATGDGKFESGRAHCIAALRPIPRVHHRKMLPFSALAEVGGLPLLSQAVKTNTSLNYGSRHAGFGPIARRKAITTTVQAKPIVPLNPLPLKKHGCDRSPIRHCSEEEFLKDVMQFLVLRGHNRLIPQGGLAEFPDAILNAKRLDLYNLYLEVVSRGGFHVGNGINWKGQVFSKMRNYTATNRMTGVGNTLKRHYETYLLEYELAHDDVDGECCLLCHSSAAGDWVNCGICGEWAHFGCDKRQGLGAFKDYAKTDGLEYICPNCSTSSFKKKVQKMEPAHCKI